MPTPVENRDEWVAWQTRRGGHGREGDVLRNYLHRRWYAIKKNRRRAAAAQARASNARAAAAESEEEDEEDNDDHDENDIDNDGLPEAPAAPEGVNEIFRFGEYPPTVPPLGPMSGQEIAREAGQDDVQHPPRPDIGSIPFKPGHVVRTPSISDLSTPILTRASRWHAKRVQKARAQAVMEDRPKFRGDAGWLPGWHTGEHLGGGGQGLIYVYCREEDDAMVDRVAVKETFVAQVSWNAFYHWYGDPRDSQNRTHVEIKCMQMIKDQSGSDKCVAIRGKPEVNDERMWHRIYMEFCPHGDLHQLIDEEGHHRDQNIPEPAIWSLLHDMVEAFLLLQYGGVEEDEVKEDWEPIIHRDIKSMNFLLDTAKANGPFPSYPKARLCDFGVAIITHEMDAMNPSAYSDGWGTLGWLAPEQQLYHHRGSLKPVLSEKLGEKTNVWGMGATIMRLMNRERNPRHPSFHNSHPEEPGWKRGQKELYSSDLCELVECCVRFKPADRPTLRVVRRRILELTTPGGDIDLARGMRAALHDEVDEDQMLYYQTDEKYKLALATS